MRQLRRWRVRFTSLLAFSLADWRAFGEAVGTLAVVQVKLGTRDFPSVLAWSTAVRSVPDAEKRWTEAGVVRLAWLVDLAGRLTRRRCLARSLALARVFGRRGLTTDVRIGVRTAEGALSAHAWVEWRGRVLNNHPDHLERFAPFERLVGDTTHG